MKNINTVTISGNIVKDAAYSKVCTFTVAVNENRKEGDESAASSRSPDGWTMRTISIHVSR